MKYLNDCIILSLINVNRGESMKDNYKKILEKIREKTLKGEKWEKVDFYQEVVRKDFVKNMGYESKDSTIKEMRDAFQIEDLLIMGSVEGKWQRAVSTLVRLMKENGCKWGILIHLEGIWLLNLDIVSSQESTFKNSKIVLEIRYGMNTDQRYFRYFSEENIIGEKKNACFFRDIIDYKNNRYKGKEKSWPAYESALKRCFDYYVEYKGDYGYEENVYDNIDYPFFVDFIKKGTGCKSLKSARNSFFYIKDFMQGKSHKGEFDNPERVRNSFPEFMPKYEMQDIMCIKKLKIALNFLEENRNGIRNKTMLLMFLAYGMERRKLCTLKWGNIHVEVRQLEMEQKKYPIPDYLMDMLLELKRQNITDGHIFCNNNGEVLSEGAINTILSSITKADVSDEFYSQLTPANIRRCLVKYLLEHEYPLQWTFYLMDMDGYKLESYVPKGDIYETFWSICEDPIVCERGQHPMENFLEQLR